MSLISENIKYLRKQKGLTQEQLSQEIGIKRSLLGAYEEGRADPRLSVLSTMAEFFNTSVDNLISIDLTIATGIENSKGGYQQKEVLAITVDPEGKQNIEWVPEKAAAGYTSGFSDPDYISDLPRFNLPMLPTHGTYRAFEISGDSMLPILPGTIIVGEYVEDLQHIKSGSTYILVTKDDGVVYKRVFNYLNENGKLFLVSDNRQFDPYQINGEDVSEVWAAKAFISIQFPDVKSESEISTEQLAKLVMDLQKEITKLKSE